MKGNSRMGMAKHRKSGHTTKSPKFRHSAKLEAERNERRDHSRIRNPSQSIQELFRGKQ